MELGREIPPRVIDSSIEQRIESHALLAEVRSWPHQAFSLTLPAHTEPQVCGNNVPPPRPEATGPANRWWFDGDRAVFAMLRSWWRRPGPSAQDSAPPDIWTVWCFARDTADLAEATERIKRAVATLLVYSSG